MECVMRLFIFDDARFLKGDATAVIRVPPFSDICVH